MSYFKHGDVVRYVPYGEGWFAQNDGALSEGSGEWVVLAVEPHHRGSDMITVTNQRERFTVFEDKFILVKPTPEERTQELLGEDYL